MVLQATHEGPSTLVDVVERILDKGVVINADITISLVGIELLGIKARIALASLETAAKYGLEFPSGTRTDGAAWQRAGVEKEECPECGKTVPVEELLEEGCPWCGWISAKATRAQREKHELLVE